MDFIQGAFFDVILAVMIIVGLLSIPVASFLLGQLYGVKMKREINGLIDRIDGRVTLLANQQPASGAGPGVGSGVGPPIGARPPTRE